MGTIIMHIYSSQTVNALANCGLIDLCCPCLSLASQDARYTVDSQYGKYECVLIKIRSVRNMTVS